MTQALSFQIGVVGIIALGALLRPDGALAGWEYSESARPKAPAPSRSLGKSTKISPDAEVSTPTRIQVFGNGEIRPAPEAVEAPSLVQPLSEVRATDYAEMLREDANFESLRNRIRTRQVSENDTVNDADYEAEAPKPRSKPVKASPVKVKPSRSTYIPPPPPMETEVITPQKSNGSKKGYSSTEPAYARGDESNAAFPYTHILPSPYTLSQGSWVFGTNVAYGVFNFFQISTDVTRTIQQQWNFQAKVPLVDFPTFIASAFVDYESFNPHQIDDMNPDVRVKRWQPGLVTGYEVSPDMAFFLGGNFNFGKDPGKVLVTSGYMRGAQINMEWSWLYNPESSRLGNNALSVGMKYDLTYSLFGLGMTHHWKNFDLGVHYTFADRNKFLPIFGFTVGGNF